MGAVKSPPNKNASQDCEPVRNGIHEEIIRACGQATHVLGFWLVGVYVMTPAASVPMKQSG